MVILGCGKDNLIIYTFFKRGGERGNWPADVDVDVDTGQNMCHFCFLATAAYVDVDVNVDSEFIFLTFSFSFDADVDVDVDALQGLLKYFGPATIADVDVDIDVDLDQVLSRDSSDSSQVPSPSVIFN